MTQPKIQGFTSLSALLILNLIFFFPVTRQFVKFYTSQPSVLEFAEPLRYGEK